MPTQGGVVNALKAGFKRDGSTNNSTAMSNALAYFAANTNKERILFFPAGLYDFTSIIQINMRGLRFIGERMRDNDPVGGTQIRWKGTGPFIQLGTDNGNSWAAFDYDGPQGFTLEDIALEYAGASTTTMANGNTYGTGTYGIRDWRSGDINLKNVRINRFENGFWGVQSDINRFWNPQITNCKTGIYAGPHSDQFDIYGLYTFQNEIAMDIDGAFHVTTFGSHHVNDGTSTNPSIRVKGDFSYPGLGLVMNSPWFEHLSTASAAVQPAFVDVDGSVGQPLDVILRNPLIETNASGGSRHTQSLVRVGNANRITIDNPMRDFANLERYVEFTGSTSPEVLVRCHRTQVLNPGFLNSGTGSPKLTYDWWGNPSVTVAPGNALGTGGTATITGDASGGYITLTLGTSIPATPQTAATITISPALPFVPKSIVLWPGNDNAYNSAVWPYLAQSSLLASSFQIKATAAMSGSPQIWFYSVKF